MTLEKLTSLIRDHLLSHTEYYPHQDADSNTLVHDPGDTLDCEALAITIKSAYDAEIDAILDNATKLLGPIAENLKQLGQIASIELDPGKEIK